MSNTHEGGRPPGDATARKRRRKRRPKGERKGVVKGGGPRAGEAPAARSAGNPGGETAPARPGAQQRGEGGRDRREAQPPRKRRKRRAKPDGSAPDSQRHFRPPAKRREDARFEPAREIPVADTPAVPRAPRRGEVFAALDLGTNNCRLLIAAPDAPGRFRVVDAFSRIVRLGEGLAASGRLREEAMGRALDALAICAAKLAAHPVAGSRLIATEACRRAENGAEFLQRVRERTGLSLEIVDRETEARLAAEGCGSLMDRAARGAVLFDIGGGSTELVLVRRAKAGGMRISGQIAGWTSLPVGVVTLSERHGGGRVVTHASYEDMVVEVEAMLHRFEERQRLADIWDGGRTHLLGTSGTVTTIAGLHLKLPRYDRRKVDGIWLSREEIDSVVGQLLSMDYDARAGNPCIGRERADLVLAGCAILDAIRRTWPSERLRVADRGLREGILNELMLDAGVWDRPMRRRAPQGASTAVENA